MRMAKPSTTPGAAEVSCYTTWRAQAGQSRRVVGLCAQNAQICTAFALIGIEPTPVQIGGSARGYQPGFALSALRGWSNV